MTFLYKKFLVEEIGIEFTTIINLSVMRKYLTMSYNNRFFNFPVYKVY